MNHVHAQVNAVAREAPVPLRLAPIHRVQILLELGQIAKVVLYPERPVQALEDSRRLDVDEAPSSRLVMPNAVHDVLVRVQVVGIAQGDVQQGLRLDFAAEVLAQFRDRVLGVGRRSAEKMREVELVLVFERLDRAKGVRYLLFQVLAHPAVDRDAVRLSVLYYHDDPLSRQHFCSFAAMGVPPLW